MLPDESEDDDNNFEVYEDLFANVTEAVWDVVGRRMAEVWRKGIVDADQFMWRAGGKELDAFISIIHLKVAGDDEVDLLNPLLEEKNFIDAHVLIDSGCTGSCIDEGFVKRYSFPTQRYIWPRPVFNADGTSNEAGLIKEYVVHNPEIDWRLGTVKFTCCPNECESSLLSEEIDEEFVRNVQMKEAAKWPPYLEEYADVFSEESFEHLPNHRT
ncbi:hypothetical protein ACEPAF_1911 [Sanghuangporus sanghuang]